MSGATLTVSVPARIAPYVGMPLRAGPSIVEVQYVGSDAGGDGWVVVVGGAWEMVIAAEIGTLLTLIDGVESGARNARVRLANGWNAWWSVGCDALIVDYVAGWAEIGRDDAMMLARVVRPWLPLR